MALVYTKDQFAYIKKLRDEGHSWSQVAYCFEEEYGEAKSPDALRMASKGSAPSPKPTKATVARRVTNPQAKITDKTTYNSVLVIPDMHIPYHHIDAFAFLEAVKAEYEPDRVVCIGDEVDKHAMSFHDHDPDLPSAGDELQEAIGYLEDLYEIFPEVAVLDSNHGSMHYRKGKHHGIPRKYLRDYADILEAPNGWSWSHELNLNCAGVPVRFGHDFGRNILQSAEAAACCLVQGHHHTDFTAHFSANTDRLIWAVTSGCLIDDDSLAFAYNKTHRKRPILGCTVILNGYPILVPMVLSRGGRWNKELP